MRDLLLHYDWNMSWTDSRELIESAHADAPAGESPNPEKSSPEKPSPEKPSPEKPGPEESNQ